MNKNDESNFCYISLKIKLLDFVLFPPFFKLEQGHGTNSALKMQDSKITHRKGRTKIKETWLPESLCKAELLKKPVPF